jgi:type II secretory pathway pseudopilin PulG
MSTDDSTYDPLEAELRRRFDDAAPFHGNADAVLESLRPRMRRARARHRAVLGGVAALALISVVAVGMAWPGIDGASVRTPPANHSSLPLPAPDPTTTTRAAEHPVATTAPAVGGSSGNNPGTHSGGGSAGETRSSDTSSPSSQPQTYSSVGGSITVSFANGRVALASHSPAPGYTAEIHDNGPTRVEVRFTNGETEWRVRVDVANGTLVPEITED